MRGKRIILRPTTGFCRSVPATQPDYNDEMETPCENSNRLEIQQEVMRREIQQIITYFHDMCVLAPYFS
jgi:hypothetical protein